MRDIVVVGGRGESEPAAFDSIAAATQIEQLFSGAACKLRDFGVDDSSTTQEMQTVVNRPPLQREGKGACVDRQLGEIVIETQLEDVP